MKIIVIAFLAGWLIDFATWNFANRLLQLGWGSPIGVGLVDAALLTLALAVRNRLPVVELDAEKKPVLKRATGEPLPSVAAARLAALAMAASRTGSLVLGIYAGFALFATGKLHLLLAQTHLTVSLLTSAAALALVLIALWLERRCALPDPVT